MRATMMDYPLTLTHYLERAGTLLGDCEIATRLPDKSMHRYRFGDFHRRARQLASALARAGLEAGRARGHHDVEQLPASGSLFRRALLPVACCTPSTSDCIRPTSPISRTTRAIAS